MNFIQNRNSRKTLIPNGIEMTVGAHKSKLICEICGAAKTTDRRPFTPEGLRAHKANAHYLRTVFGSIPRRVGTDLTLRQVEVMELLSQGRTIKKISRRLGLSYNTVRTHVKRSYVKLGVKNQKTAVIAFLNNERVGNHKRIGIIQDTTNADGKWSQRIPRGIGGILKFCPLCGCDLAIFTSALLASCHTKVETAAKLI